MDLSTTYLGLSLKHPIVASASPLSRDFDGIRRLEDAGAAAVVLPSLFEEEIENEIHRLDHFLDFGTESVAEATSYFPEPQSEPKASETYLKTISDAKARIKVPIIASLNGASPGGWIKYATMMEEAGADAIELNLYYLPTDPDQPGHRLETQYLQTIQYAVSCVRIPVSVKIGPYFSSLPYFARQVAEAGASGLVIFNRFYQPDIDLETLSIVPSLTLSRGEDLRLPLRWTAILSSRLDIDIAVSSGVHSSSDVIKAVMVGAKVAMTTSELLRQGVGRISVMLGEIEQWMKTHEYESISQMRASMNYKGIGDPSVFERANYMEVLRSYPLATTGLMR